MGLLRCAFPGHRRGRDLDAPLDSDGECEVGECHAEPVAARDFGSDVVVAAAEILDEGMTGSQDPR